MNTATDIIRTLQHCHRLTEFLETDLKSTNEVGFSLGENGTVYEFREGDWDQMTFAFPPDPDERRIVIHTHPSIDFDVTLSESDVALGDHPAVCGMVVLVQEMFDVNWDGRALYFGEDGETDEATFRIECDGTTDGPARDRWVENPRFR